MLTSHTRSLLALLAACAVAPVAAGQAPPADASAVAAEAPPVTVAIRAPEEVVDADALRSSLERDLGVRVEIVRPERETDARVIVEHTPDGLVRMRVRRDGRPPLTRETETAADPARTTVTVSLLLSNLVRDESAELLATLRITLPEREVEPEPEPAPEPPTVIVAPPEPAPAPPPAPEPEPAPSDAPEVPFAIDFVPMVGFSSVFAGADRRAVSIGVIGGLEGSLSGVAMSSVLDLSLGDVDGAQLVGVAAIAGGALRGAQLSGVASIAAGDVDGAQLSGVLSVTPGALRGFQLSGIGTIASSVDGLQGSGVFTLSAGPMRGAQLSVVNVAAGTLDGAQLGVINVAGDAGGAQLGVINVAGATEGAQLGLVNVAAGRVRGLQLGLLNFAERADAQLGLFSVQSQGRNHLRVGADTNGLLGVSFVHGGEVTHSILSASVMPFIDRPVVALGVGLGARARLADIVHLDFEGLGHALIDERVGQAGPGFMGEARILCGVRLIDGLAVYGGVSYRVQLLRSDPPELDQPLLAHEYGSGSPVVRGFPAIVAGLELF